MPLFLLKKGYCLVGTFALILSSIEHGWCFFQEKVASKYQNMFSLKRPTKLSLNTASQQCQRHNVPKSYGTTSPKKCFPSGIAQKGGGGGKAGVCPCPFLNLGVGVGEWGGGRQFRQKENIVGPKVLQSKSSPTKWGNCICHLLKCHQTTGWSLHTQKQWICVQNWYL